MSDPTPGKVSTQFRSLFRSLVLDPELVRGEVLSIEWIAEVVAQEVGKTCDRIFTPLVTLALFLGQVFSDDHSCRSAVARLLAWRTAHGLPECSPDSGGYCKARRRLPDTLLPRLTRESADRHEREESTRLAVPRPSRGHRRWLDREHARYSGQSACLSPTQQSEARMWLSDRTNRRVAVASHWLRP